MVAGKVVFQSGVAVFVHKLSLPKPPRNPIRSSRCVFACCAVVETLQLLMHKSFIHCLKDRRLRAYVHFRGFFPCAGYACFEAGTTAWLRFSVKKFSFSQYLLKYKARLICLMIMLV